MITIDFTYYTNTYKGFTVPSDQFGFYIDTALEHVYEGTPNATDEEREDESVIDKVKKCACEIADKLYKDENKDNIASEKVGSYSVTYKSESKADNIDNSIYSTVTRRLGRTGLIYRGIS